MPIERKEVEHIAKLARLRFSDEELERMASELEKILDYIQKLEELDTANVEPMTHVHLGTDALRDDVLEKPLSRKAALSNAPDTDGTYFRVPKVID